MFREVLHENQANPCTLTLNMLSFWGHEYHYQYCCVLLHEQKWCMGHGEVAVLVDSLKG